MDIPFNMEFSFDESLREVPVSIPDMKSGVSFLKDQLHTKDSETKEQAALNGLIGVYCRILKNFEESKKYLLHAIEINEKLNNKKGWFVNELRLAHTYQWEGDFQKSNGMFGKLLKDAECSQDTNDYLDFLYQHQGKNLFEQQNYELAAVFFEKALVIRMEKGNEELIVSTRHALEVCSNKKNDSLHIGKKKQFSE
ncbi:tetratricopeptide repeat protein [Bacillus sp. FJAT-27445]|uniref:tetratricopeptide repeat protein n=1 Tax=Bacillus sp. FJAT-27445 TaxID=1679166 RepID=UPI0007439A3F|nr:tetratricopeptide repeat protein [Bacillus sp. FJAT-27445]